ncbi:helix-turn-helix transcriptional regulator [Methylobacterium sp. J-001]|uniref:helix-turn-helix domain-containing protein n=1 Tax=unclassified Methylobacterium TaxID=2615210 RepID=UPI001FB9DA91|nr:MULTISPECIES: helix-turn-helix transcriptional regulator [unclassified Methylobacterium]MCJ2095948.1 helix-turn-helix transcriptional regulator [Methylobacterium sp. J-072]MCJ2116872.1 helix-turn-helix transcriptional regulator [Methylobacterium sp. J-001]
MSEIELSEAQSRAIAQIVREALARRRISRQTLAEEARISLSTLEKALAGRRPFTLATTIRLEEALGQSLRQPTGQASAPELQRHAPDELGAYAREGVSWLEGRYLTLRPSFETAGAIFAYRTEIAWDAGSARLVFREAERVDAPFAQSGSVAVPSQSGMIYLVTNWHGQHRLAVLCRPNIRGEMYGILTTLHAGRGTQLTPATAPLALVPERPAAELCYGRIAPHAPTYAAYRAHLDRVHTDGYATFFIGAP